MHKDRKLPLAEQKLPPYWEKDILAGKKMVEEILGKGVDIYCFGWDEPSMARLRGQRLPWKFLHDNGLKTYSTAHSAHLLHGGYNEDFVNYGGSYDKASAAKWHALGARITTYAAPHTGPENPDVVRRNHGMDLYLCDFDGTNNYELDGGWNDFRGATYNFRGFNWIYPGTIEPINTIQFEGFREAIDDVKYATLDEILEHCRRDLKVSNHAVLERTHRRNRAGGTTDHLLGLATDRHDLILLNVDSHNRRLTHHNAFTAHIHERVGGTQVNTDITIQKAENSHF
jgi:hypothetical protein